MTDNKPATAIAEATGAMRDAVKAVPSLIVLVALWFLFLRYVFGRWQLLAALSAVDRGSLASILAVPLALVTHFLGNVWDDRVFDPRYTVDPTRKFRGKWLDTNRRNFFGLMPAGSELEQARANAMKALKLPSEEGLYGKAKHSLEVSRQWGAVGRLLFLSKLCRGLIWPSFLVAGGLFAQVIYALVTKGQLDSVSLLGALLFLLFGALLFIPYINLRVDHMVELYRRASSVAQA